MQSIRSLNEKKRKKERKEKTQEFLRSRRVWEREPSIIVALPYIIDHRDWSDFDSILSAITQKDIELLPANLKSYIQDKFKEYEGQEIAHYNLLRLMNRLRMWGKTEVSRLVRLMRESQCVLRSMQLIKEFAIYGQFLLADDRNIADHFGQELLNESLTAMGEFQLVETYQTDTEFLLSYIYIIHQLAPKCLAFYAANTLELVKLLGTGLAVESEEVNAKTISTITKILGSHMDPQFSNIIQPMLKLVVEKEQLARMIHLISQGDIETVAICIDFLGELFQISDALLETTLLFKRIIPCKSKDDPRVNLLVRSNHVDLSSCLLELTRHIFGQIRYKTYWLISNITGSSDHYWKLGMPFIESIFKADALIGEEQNSEIFGEVALCVLNFICNLNFVFEIRSIMKCQQLGSNLLFFLIGVLKIVLSQIEGSNMEFMERSVFGIANLLRICKDDSELENLVKCTMEKSGLPQMIESAMDGKSEQMVMTMEGVLTILQGKEIQ